MAGKTVLVTGASGFIASVVIDNLLTKGYTVKGTVRSPSKSKDLVTRYAANVRDRLSLVAVADIASSDLSEALEGVDAILHVASPYTFTVKDNEKDLMKPALEGTDNVVKSAMAHGVKRVVVTSSFAAINDMVGQGVWRDYTYTEKDWLPMTYEQGAKKETSALLAYCASKKVAEERAWQIAKENPGKLELTTFCPPMVYGPGKQQLSKGQINTSSNNVFNLINRRPEMPPTQLPLFVDVRDLAKAHVLAIEHPDSIGKRISACGGDFFWDEAAAYLREERPELKDRLPPASATQQRGQKPLAKCDVSVAKEALGIGEWIGWKQCVLDSVDDLLAREKADWQ